MFLIFFDLGERWQRAKGDWSGPKLHMDVYLKETRPTTVSSVEEYKDRYILLSVDVHGKIATRPLTLVAPSAQRFRMRRQSQAQCLLQNLQPIRRPRERTMAKPS